MSTKKKLTEKAETSKSEKVVRTTFNVFTTVVVVIVVIFALLIVGVRAFGIDVYIVLSPSMKDQYPPGSLIYVKEVDPATLEVGDDITFRLTSDMPATHRIIEILYDEIDPTKYSFRTQGTANELPDANPVLPENIIGKALFAIPLLGYAVDFIQQPMGIYICAAGAIFLIILMLIPDVLFPKESEKKKKKKGEDAEHDASAEPSEPDAAPETDGTAVPSVPDGEIPGVPDDAPATEDAPKPETEPANGDSSPEQN